ncbi:MAG: hypothetical protein NC548_51570 [Lachnospiraceae bacterium]|nr:hypothetical protein [Lachnospiraceae bacterium]
METVNASEIISIQDMQKILGNVSYGYAAKKIREVKLVSDVLGISGKIHQKDWVRFLDRYR